VRAEDFARVLAARLNAIVPEGFYVRADERMVWYSQGPSHFGWGHPGSGTYAVESYFAPVPIRWLEAEDSPRARKNGRSWPRCRPSTN
jgi:hypothetical protein